MIVNDELLIESIKGEDYSKFIQFFPKVKSLFDEIKEEESVLKNKNHLQTLRNQKNFKQKMKLVFGNNVVFAEDQVNKPQRLKYVSDVLEIEPEKYKDWFISFYSNQKNILLYDVCYNSKIDRYIATVRYIDVSV